MSDNGLFDCLLMTPIQLVAYGCVTDNCLASPPQKRPSDGRSVTNVKRNPRQNSVSFRNVRHIGNVEDASSSSGDPITDCRGNQRMGNRESFEREPFRLRVR